MLAELKFVQGAVGKKEFIPAITHFCIENGTVRAYNGTIALCSPIACDLKVTPKAIPMVHAIARCQDTIRLSMTAGGRLTIASGKFRTHIDCIEETQAHVQPEGIEKPINGDALLTAIKAVLPFVSNDASRPWSTGVLLKGNSAYATNNVCIVEAWVGGEPFPRVVNLPRAAVMEMVRIGQGPTHAQFGENSITFHYKDGRWLRSQLYSTDWPSAVYTLMNVKCNRREIPKELFEGLDSIRPFMNKLQQVFVSQEGLRTHFDINEGASYQMDWFEEDKVYSLDMLNLLDGVATHADFSIDPAMFFGDTVRGALLAMRMPDAPRPE